MIAGDLMVEAVRLLRASLPPESVEVDLDLAQRTTYRVGGAAAVAVTIERPDDLLIVAEVVARTDLDTLVVGRGSNLLIADRGFGGVAIILGSGLAGVDVDGVTVCAGGAANLPVVARRTASLGLRGFEWAVGVPGSIGGAVRMNAGGHGSNMAENLVRADVVDVGSARRRWWTAADLDLGYRVSALGPQQVVVAAELGLQPGDQAEAEAELDEVVRWRRANQPGGQNAGSVFTNPASDSAGRLIEAAGCKGLRVGSAAVSTKHANFIQADAGGSAADVLRLMLEVKRRVREVHGVSLEAETVLVGFDLAEDTP